MFKKVMGWLLICALLMTVAAGCKKTGKGNESANSASKGSKATASNESTSEDDGDESGDDTAQSGDGSNGGTDSKNAQSAGSAGKSSGNVASNPGDGKLPENVKPGEIVQASFTRNADGTCTDRATGIIFLDDDLDDWSKTSDRGTDLIFDSNEAALFEGDSSRVVRGNSKKDCWFTYKLNTGITEAGVVTYTTDKSIVLNLLVSKDNKNWTKLTTKSTDVSLGFTWIKRIYTVTGIDKANIYFKIQFESATTTSYNPNIGRLRLNNIAKMNDADRYLENRASATFYVDSKSGSDNNNGLSQNKPFKSLFKVSSKFYQPGDKILFKKGNSYSGSLTIKGYGSAANPITISSYGSGDKPKISARGGTALTVKATYITVDDLEVTNPTGTIGIYVIASQASANKNITISNCYVHDVNTNETKFDYETGGIIVYADAADPVWFDGLVVKDNIIKNVARTGILLTTQWAYRPGRWGHSGKYVNDDNGWYPYVNCKVQGNSLDSTRGDSIMCAGAKGLIIEKNVVYNAFSTTKQTGIACAALWTTNTNDTIMQYNEVGYTKLPPGNDDGEGYDIDISEVRTVVQYNYSHNNAGGFLLICNSEAGQDVSKNAIVRYNLSVNDATKSGQGIFMLTRQNKNTQIYNNTIFIGGSARTVYPIWAFSEAPSDYTFTNNIFYGLTTNTYSWVPDKVKNFNFTNNIFYGISAPTTSGGMVVTGSKTDNPGFTVKNWTEAEYKNKASMIKAFTPSNKISGASTVSNNGGKDINGAAISSQFYGAVKY